MSHPKKAKRKKQSARRSTPPKPQPGAAEDTDQIEDLLVAGWSRSRAGGRSNRGFHFQDAVGAWLAARIVGGDLAGELVPEGFDDMTVEGQALHNHQVKSRADHLGAFPPGVAAGHVLDTWKAALARTGDTAPITVVLERGIASDETLDQPSRVLSDTLIPGSPLDGAIRRTAARQKLTDDQIMNLLGRTTVIGASWPSIDGWTDTLLGSVATVPPAALSVLRRVLYAAVAEASDVNGSVKYDDRRRLTRTELAEAVTAAVELVDVDGLESALLDGLCAPLRYELDPRATDAYYEGAASMPSHVASGLVVPRPDVVAQVIAAIDAGRPALIIGPSGVGKSAVAWTVPIALSGVLWFRVLRLNSDTDAHEIIRLARAYGANPEAPVGLIVDGAGAGQRAAWSNLHALVAAEPGVVLIGTARNEDLLALGSLTDVSTVAVALDEHAASIIFQGLKRRGATTEHHWLEAFQSARGLTLEFTHLLTRGQRIDDVISDQIRDRRVGERDDELDLLSLVAMADQWSATLEMSAVAEATHRSTFDLRRSIDRLAEEHLLVEQDGVLSGLHPVRSQAITRAVHSTPPPSLSDTFARSLELVSTGQLARFSAQALRYDPTLVVQVGVAAEASVEEPARLAALLQGLRLSDADTRVSGWVEVLDALDARRALRMTLVMMATAELDLGDPFPPTTIEAVGKMIAVPPGTWRDELADRIGAEQLGRTLLSATVADATALVATLDGWTGDLQPALNPASPLASDLATVPISAVTRLLAAAGGRSDGLSPALLDSLGGTNAMLQRLQDENPWILEAEVRDGLDGPLGHARLMHVHDADGDSREACVTLARHLLRMLPQIDATDVKAVGPGNVPIIIGGHDHGSSGLIRRNDHAETTVAWDQAQIKAALARMGGSDTDRLAAACHILRDLVPLVAVVGSRWARSDNDPDQNARLTIETIRLSLAAGALPPPVGRMPASGNKVDESETVSILDPVSELVTNLTDNALGRLNAEDTNLYALSAFLRDTVQRNITAALTEPWHLVPEGDAAMVALDELAAEVWELHDCLRVVRDEPAAARPILNAARKGSRKGGLRRAAVTARHMVDHRAETRRTSFEGAICSEHPGTEICVLTDYREGLTNLAVVVEVDSLPDWDATAILETARASAGDHEQIVLVPLRQGRRIELLGVRLGIETDVPLLELGAWASVLPEAHPAVLGNLVRTASASLQLLSGVSSLESAQRNHPKVVSLVADTEATYAEALEAIGARDVERLCSHLALELAETAARVESEFEDDFEGITYAEQMLRHVLGTPTDEGLTATARWLYALELEIEPGLVPDL